MDPDLVRQQNEAEGLSRMTDRSSSAHPETQPARRPDTPAPQAEPAAVEAAWHYVIPPASADELPDAAYQAWPMLAASAKSALIAFLGALMGHAAGLAGAGFLDLDPTATLAFAGGSSVAFGLGLGLWPLVGKGRARPAAALGAIWPGAVICAGAIVVAALRAPILDAANPWHWGGLTLAGVASIALAWAVTHTRLKARVRPLR